MGCGKSSLGKRVARVLGIPFVDTDKEVERAEQADVADIFRYAGEEYFRRAERAALERVIASEEDCVVATGGGLPLWGDNMDVMKAAGATVYICRSAENIASRLTPYGRMKRPRLRGLDDGELMERMRSDIADREPVYRRAETILEADASGDGEMTARIVELCRERMGI